MSFNALNLRLGRVVPALLLPLLLSGSASAQWKSSKTYVLPDLSLSDFIQGKLGITANDHGVLLGGIGSDLWHSPGDPANTFWMITDRGPNGQISVNGQTRRTFPVPEFTPLILKVRTTNKGLRILDSIPLVGLTPAEKGTTGLSNTSRDEVPYGCDAQTVLNFNPHGVDTEGLVRMADGTFWVAEEYGPSLLKVDPYGVVEKRFLPAGLTPNTVTTGYLSVNTLPEILGKRKGNRGFEGLTLSQDGTTLYAVVQSPLTNPNSATGNASRSTRILAFDVKSEGVVGEYVYRFQPSTEFAGETNPAEMKVSALAMINRTQMLVLERTDKVAKIYRVDLDSATNILNSKWDAVATTPTLEALSEADLAQNNVKPYSKKLILEVDSAKGFPPKIEGLTVLDDRTIAIANDNDFGVGDFAITPDSCRLIDTGLKSFLIVIKLEKRLTE